MVESADSDAMVALQSAMTIRGNQLHDPEADKHLFVEFETRPVLQEAESAKEGRPVYKDTDYIKICRPGDKHDMVHRPVWMDQMHRASDYYRFGRQYRAWKEGKAQEASGTPLSILADIGIMTKSDVAGFQHFNVRTAEQFVSMTDADAQKFPGFQQMKTAVQAYLSKSKESAPAARMAAELKERDLKLAEQKAALEQQADALKTLAEQLMELKRGQTQNQKSKQ